MGDLVDKEGVIWNGEYATHALLPQQSHISPVVEEMHGCSHSFDEMIVAHNTLKVKSAFIRYNKESSNGFKLNQKSFMKLKLAKRCFAFLRRVHENEREKSRSEVDVHFMEESYASTHRIAERNKRINRSQQFMALQNILGHNPKVKS